MFERNFSASYSVDCMEESKRARRLFRHSVFAEILSSWRIERCTKAFQQYDWTADAHLRSTAHVASPGRCCTL